MNVRKSAGLVCAGGVNQSFLARMPALLARLGPVKGSSLRVSRRVANGLKAGTGVGQYHDLEGCDFIWISVPECQLDAIAHDLAASVRLEGKMIVLCGVFRDSHFPSPLTAARARVATLNSVPESSERVFVAEGNPAVVAEIRKLLALDGRKLIEIRSGSKPLYLSGILAAHMLLPWIAGSVESFRAAGFSRNEAVRAMEAMGIRALRSYAKAGHKAHNEAEASRLRTAVQKQLETIRMFDERLADLFAEQTGNLPLTPGGPARTTRRGPKLELVKPNRAKLASG
jgi:hypothetical protein